MMMNTDSSPPQSPSRLSLFLQFFVFFLLIIALYFPSVERLFSRWIQWDQDLSHGLPTIAIFLFLVWRSPPWPYKADSKWVSGVLLLILCALSLAWFLFYKINIALLAYLSILCILIFFIACCYSLKTLGHLLVPCGVLIFAIPLWGMLNGPLVQISAAVVGELARLSGLTILMDGNNIFIPYGRLYIDDGCSGLRYFVIALLMAYLISHLNHYRIKHTLIAFAVAILLALLTNWIRIFSLVVIGYQTEMKSSLMEDHELFGWALFALVMLPAIYFAPAFKPSVTVSDTTVKARPILPLLILLMGPLLMIFTRTALVMPPIFTLSALTSLEVVGSATGVIDLAFPDSPMISTKSISAGETSIKVTLAQYSQTDPQGKLVPYFRSLYNRDSWSVTLEQSDDNSGLRFSVLRRPGTEQYQLLAHIYHVGRYPTNQYEIAKLLQIPAMLLGDSYFTIFTAQTVCGDQACAKEMLAVNDAAKLWIANPTQQNTNPAY